MSTITKTSKPKTPKKPTYKPMPKAPKMSASVEAWKRYNDQVNKVAAENLKKKAKYEKELAAVKAVAKAKQAIKDRVAATKKRVPFGVRKSDNDTRVFG